MANGFFCSKEEENRDNQKEPIEFFEQNENSWLTVRYYCGIDLKSLVHEQKIPSITTLLYDLSGAQAV